MNIFKVLASGYLPEEAMSALLAWLMDPNEIEHGLSRLFLDSFLKTIGFNGYMGNDDKMEYHLEMSLKGDDKDSRIDIVYVLEEKYVIAIENKINERAYRFNQLMKEYNDLQKKFNQYEITLVYLVPEDKTIYSDEFHKLNVTGLDKKCFLTWTDDIHKIVKHILSNEIIETTPIRTKICLEMLNEFLLDGFISKKSSGWANMKNYGNRISGKEIYKILCQPGNEGYYVGRQRWQGKNGIESILEYMTKSVINVEKFQIDIKPSYRKPESWMTGKRFKQIYNKAP